MFKFLNKKNVKSNQEVWIITGLGNPGPEYDDTRHNCGFKTIDTLIKKLGEGNKETVKFKGKYVTTEYKGKKVVLLKPQTYMNNSGESVDGVMNWFKTDEKHLIVIFDDYAIDLGQVRIKSKGSAGSHNGMKSVIQYVGSDNFARVKIGIGPKNPNMDTSKFVLGHFSAEEKEKLTDSFEKAAEAVLLIVDKNIDMAMNRFNSKGTN